MDIDSNSTHIVGAVASALGLASDTVDTLHSHRWALAATAALFVTYLTLTPRRPAGWKPPPNIPERIPFVSNGWAFMRNPQAFLDHVSSSMRAMGTGVATVYVGPVPITIVMGAERVRTAMFRERSGLSPDRFLMMVMGNVEGMTREDLKMYTTDGSGRGKKPREGWEGFPPHKRVWARQRAVAHDVLGRKVETDGLAERFQGFFGERIEMREVGVWEQVVLGDVLRGEMAEAASRAMVGTEVFEMVPDLVERFWRYDAVALRLMLGMPQWWDREAYRVRDGLLEVLEGYLQDVLGRVTLDDEGKFVKGNGEDDDPDWEPMLGSRFNRSVAGFGLSAGLSMRAVAGGMAMSMFGLNSNSIPVTQWAVFELVRDKELLAAVREEVAPALRGGVFDIEMLEGMPLLQAVYLETMRLHVAISITREAVEDVRIDGFDIPKGRMVQAPTSFGGEDEAVWGEDVGVWRPGRHLRDDGKGGREFVVSAKAGEFFPYGGGATVCAGRHFAKQEIMLGVAVMVSRFDIEFVEWTMLDGGVSEREARGDVRYVGAAAVPPDRDMRVRWRRQW
ncbi:cytochrome P450 [Plectosphaerella plurivora]|uniref:Cytochrome P450 n=1 Tax=Plectosphaerella plurivora TaxID=936078 RepID=A0A9P8VD59_9PEZI|nr:cytochrome P450 [Plectosphaerella plurivora]